MVRSLFSGLSGIKSNQLSLDVIGNNVANVNTPSFKSGSASFADTFALTIRGGSAPSEGSGGLDPLQVGRGSTVGSVKNSFIQGSMESTNNPTDIGLIGEGFFILKHGTEEYFTRDGSFDIDANGNLVDPGTGYAVQGRMANSAGEIISSTPIGNIVLPSESLFPAKATSKVSFSGNLDAAAGIADTGSDGIDAPDESYQTSVLIYDSLGDGHTVKITFGLTDTPNEWTWEAALIAGDTNVISDPSPGSGLLHFNADGTIDNVTTPAEVSVDITISGAAGAGNPLNNGAAEQITTLNFEQLMQFSGSFSPIPVSRDGHGMGALASINFDSTGKLNGTFTNGATQTLAQLVLADFYNPAGLTKTGNNMYSVSMNSGAPIVGTAGSGIRASVAPGALETSNVDLANEFTRMIIAQRGFEANSRVVMTSDSILGDLINLKR